MSQAWNRIRRLEQDTGVEVIEGGGRAARACSEPTLGVLARLGYEAACISHTAHFTVINKDKDWTPENRRRHRGRWSPECRSFPGFAFLMIQVEHDSAGPRILNQPIIPVGHHQDVADGMKMLETVADFINSLGQNKLAEHEKISRGGIIIPNWRAEN